MKNISFILTLLISASICSGTTDAQWIQQNSGTSQRLTDVVMLDTATAIAVGHDYTILRTTDAGTTWNDGPGPPAFVMTWNGISFFDAAHGIIVGDHGNCLTTSNGGISWMRRFIPAVQNHCLSALCIGPAGFFAGDDSGYVYFSSDTGSTWTTEKISVWPIRSLFTYRGPTTMGAPILALTPYSLCTRDLNPPFAWSEAILTNFQGLGSEAADADFCNRGGAGFIVGVHGDWRAAPTIVRKPLGDTAWNDIPIDIMRDGILLGVSAPSENVIFACGSSGMIFKSSDGGDSWIDQSRPTSRTINAIFFYDETHGVAVGDSGLILFTSNGGVTVIEVPEDPFPAKFTLEQNYPNPFNPGTTISFTLPSRSFVTLKVFDLVGREVATIASETLSAGNYTRQWHAEGVPTGVYFYRLTAGSLGRTKKMLVLK